MNRLNELSRSLQDFLPLPWGALLCLAAGMALALGFRLLVPRVFVLIRLNRLSDRLGITNFLRKGEVGYAPGQLAAVSLFWGTLLLTLLFVMQLVDRESFEAVTRPILVKMPLFLTGLILAVLGVPAVTFLGNFVRTLARNAGIPYANLLSRATKWMGWVFVGLMALEQLNLGTGMVGTTFLILFAASGLGLAIAFGLGCKDLARMAMERFLANLRENHRDRGGGDLEG